MKILVTGGCGFIGHNVCVNLAAKGHEVVCVDRAKAPFVDEFHEIKFIQSDLFADVTKETYDEFPTDVDAIVHLASSSIPETANRNMYKDVKDNVLGALRLMNYAVDVDAKMFLFMSSGGTVYGPQLQDIINEECSKKPICCYGATKLAIENYMRLYRREYNLCTLALRLANPYGRFQRIDAKQGIIPIFCRKALMNEEIQIFGDGTVERDFIHVDDLCIAIDRALDTYLPKYHDVENKVYLPSELNIGSSVGTSLNEILYLISKTIGKELKVRYLSNRSFDVKRNVLDIVQAKRYLNWQPNIKIEAGIRMLLEHFKDQLRK